MIRDVLQNRLVSLVERHEEIRALLSDEKTIKEQNRFRDLSKEYAQLEPLVNCYQDYQKTQKTMNVTESMLKESDETLRTLAEEEMQILKKKITALEEQLQYLLLPQDPNDSHNIFLEIRAAAGGDESSIFAGDLFRMYVKYAQSKHWQVEVIHENPGEQGGYKIIVARVSGQNVYSNLKFESGAHRVQRVPETENQGRVHTSTCTVAILPEMEEIDEVIVNPVDLKIDTFRASGAGGQHVNKTDSAIRITHLPSGVVVECQDERSQHKNRARAMSLLQSKLLDREVTRQRQAQAQTRKSLVGTGERSERIRTYNFPQGRLTDHRINLTIYKLVEVMEGELTQVIEPLRREYQSELLSTLEK
ncbi:MAG: hypothetical protein ACD_44C00453G0004 [uncultured bacterium]|nr:MAG: hypothetical protein ACD_44C00453G0004 [uncultured bacterium]